MRSLTAGAAIAAAILHAVGVSAQACEVNLQPDYPAPVVANGYQARLIVSGLSRPRGLIFDKNNNLLVVESRTGIRQISFKSDDTGTCLVAGRNRSVLNMGSLTHGIELSPDGKYLFASDADKVYRWDYDSESGVLSKQRTLIQNMTNSDHVTRTLLLSKQHPDLLLVSRGSSENVDSLAADITSGVSQIRAFNLSSLASTPVDYSSSGTIIGWGLRNSVGLAEHPLTFNLYSVENSVDQVRRNGQLINEDNPGEELNSHGILSPTPTSPPPNFGYPSCIALWSTAIPSPGNLKVGSQFALSPPTTDEQCNSPKFVPPRLTFEAHNAPLDIKFSSSGELAYISMHGSWNRKEPAGYKISAVTFSKESGEPVEKSDSTKAAVDVLSNRDLGRCPEACFRPAGLAVDGKGRVWMSSDSTGDIWVVQKVDGEGGGNGGRESGAAWLVVREGRWGVVIGTVVVGALGVLVAGMI